MQRLKKYILSIVFCILLIFTLTSCFKTDYCYFQDSIYILDSLYDGKIGEHEIEDCSMELKKITEEEYLNQEGKNILCNYKTKEYYYVILNITFKNNSQNMHYYFMEKKRETDQPDCYALNFFLVNNSDSTEEKFRIKFVFHLNRSNHSHIAEKVEMKARKKQEDGRELYHFILQLKLKKEE